MATETHYKCHQCKNERPLTAEHWPQKMIDLIESGETARNAEKIMFGYTRRHRNVPSCRCYECYVEGVRRPFVRRFWHHARTDGELFERLENVASYSPYRRDNNWLFNNYAVESDLKVWKNQIIEKFRRDLADNNVTVDDDWEQYLPEFMRFYPAFWDVPTAEPWFDDFDEEHHTKRVAPRDLIPAKDSWAADTFEWDSTWSAPIVNPDALIKTGLFPERYPFGGWEDTRITDAIEQWELDRRIQSLTPREILLKAERIALTEGGKYTAEYRALIDLYGHLREAMKVAVDCGREGVQTVEYQPTLSHDYKYVASYKDSFNAHLTSAIRLCEILLIDICPTVALMMACAENLDRVAHEPHYKSHILYGFQDYVMENWVNAEPIYNEPSIRLPFSMVERGTPEKGVEMFEAIVAEMDAKHAAEKAA